MCFYRARAKDVLASRLIAAARREIFCLFLAHLSPHSNVAIRLPMKRPCPTHTHTHTLMKTALFQSCRCRHLFFRPCTRTARSDVSVGLTHKIKASSSFLVFLFFFFAFGRRRNPFGRTCFSFVIWSIVSKTSSSRVHAIVLALMKTNTPAKERPFSGTAEKRRHCRKTCGRFVLCVAFVFCFFFPRQKETAQMKRRVTRSVGSRPSLTSASVA